VVYVFNIERFKPIIRPTILTAFSGYLLVIVALLFDLGRPYRIWHPLVMWNPRSVMFEVAWCVTLYTLVLALEFSPILFQRLRLEKPLRIIQSITSPLVMLGVILSTLHQSSLGSLYLIVPHKLPPLVFAAVASVLLRFSDWTGLCDDDRGVVPQLSRLFGSAGNRSAFGSGQSDCRHSGVFT
jgi:Ni/Fe-hydrogenase subunit HybB-like protein